MIERVHEHIITEPQQNTRTDTIFFLTAILLNLTRYNLFLLVVVFTGLIAIIVPFVVILS